ncbi:hypothetical protein CFC21_085542 [Triticum aestivum]|uniref:Late embryogenesis abundant protein LEA-2 subgroup domain-containing protein n=2 Tax=Triticum aestivum TaxID=4565 RepID=A0A9R1ICF5_WHEAT|nr:hypothetical protein CFC21_085542 [Triticum aestivum]
MSLLGMAHRRRADLRCRLRPNLRLRDTGDIFYSIAIDSASGLDPPSPTDFSLARPEFNLTFRVTTDGLRRTVCVDAGIYVEVSYRCVPLAASPTTPQRICVAPRKASDVPMLARGARIRLPGYMMDSLAADIRSGVEAFGVTLKQSSGGALAGEGENVAKCGARRVGDVPARCDTLYTCPDGDPSRSAPHSAAASPRSTPHSAAMGNASQP